MIYPVRPTQCRTWPFWEDNLKSPQAWKNASERGRGCPGMCDAEAPRYPLEHIEKCRQHPERARGERSVVSSQFSVLRKWDHSAPIRSGASSWGMWARWGCFRKTQFCKSSCESIA